MKQITTETYRLSPSDYIKEIMKRWTIHNLLWLTLPVITAVAAGFMWNHAMFYVSAMLVFLVLPSVLMFAYFNYALTTKARIAIMPRRVTITGKGIRTDIIKTEEDVETVTETIVNGASELSDIEISFGKIVITLNDRYSFVQIPLSALPDNVSIIDLCMILENQS